MARLNWGRDGAIGLDFDDDCAYYETLGFLCQPNKVVVYTHENQESGARAFQGKLDKRHYVGALPTALQRSFDASGDPRLSITDYVENLKDNHMFISAEPIGTYTRHFHPAGYDEVRNTVPNEYWNDFDRGYNM